MPKAKSLIRTSGKSDEKLIYCRKCMKDKAAKEYYSATDTVLDKNNFMSICRKCCGEIYDNAFTVERNFEKALLRTCKILNVGWNSGAVDSTRTHIDKLKARGQEDISVFGIYKSKLSTLSNLADDQTLTFEEPSRNAYVDPNEVISDDEEFNKYLKSFWGAGLQFEDYEFLESELNRYKKTHKCDTATEESLLRQICFAEFDIRNARISGGTPDANVIKRLQELMKTASIDPAKAASANSGKSQETFSAFIKTIENNEPAEFYKNKALFKDFDNLDFYFKKYVTRPLKNFITQSRDFNVETEDDVDEVVERDSEDDGDFTATL